MFSGFFIDGFGGAIFVMMLAISFVCDLSNDKGETSVKLIKEGGRLDDEEDVLVIFFDDW